MVVKQHEYATTGNTCKFQKEAMSLKSLFLATIVRYLFLKTFFRLNTKEWYDPNSQSPKKLNLRSHGIVYLARFLTRCTWTASVLQRFNCCTCRYCTSVMLLGGRCTVYFMCWYVYVCTYILNPPTPRKIPHPESNPASPLHCLLEQKKVKYAHFVKN